MDDAVSAASVEEAVQQRDGSAPLSYEPRGTVSSKVKEPTDMVLVNMPDGRLGLAKRVVTRTTESLFRQNSATAEDGGQTQRDDRDDG